MARASLDLPAYLGSTLRGAFGHVFRAMACPGRFDQPCPIPETCPYHLIFETSPPPGSEALRTHEEVPRPFVIAPITRSFSSTNNDGGWLEQGRRQIAPGSELSFDLTLIGRAQDFFPYFVVAFREIDRLGRRPSRDHPRPHFSVGEGRVRVPDTLQRQHPAARDVIPSEPSGSDATRDVRSSVIPSEPSASEPTRDQRPPVIPSEPSSSKATRDQLPSVIPSEASASEATRDQREAIYFSPARPSRTVELRRIDLLDPLSGTTWPVYDSAENIVRPMRKQLTLADCAALPPPPSDRLTLNFLTQTRLKHEGGFARIPEFQIVFRRLLGRLSSLSRFHCGAPLEVDFRAVIDRAANVRLIDNQTRWVSWTRYSNRQRQRMDWEGLIGRATYEGDFAGFWPYLPFGARCHVGKGTTFGLGKFKTSGCNSPKESCS